ncbi:MAG: hypothetical protein ACI8ZN_001655 [Bacteroidia bacterium]|jgi:hypothetical protein
MKLKTILAISIIALMGSQYATSQVIKMKPFEPKQGILLSIQYGAHSPGGDLVNRFGWNSTIGLDAKFKTEKGWLFGGSYRWMFGNNVKESNMFDSILGSSREIIDKNGLFSVIRLSQRGHMFMLEGGKIIPLSKQNRNSGILIQAGFGYVMHRIDVFASTTTVPQVTGDYEKGYDRLNGGMGFNQYIGYQYLDPKKRVNFNIGFSSMQAYTKSLRSVDYLTKSYNTLKRKDYLSGVIIGVTIPIYTKKRESELFFED